MHGPVERPTDGRPIHVMPWRMRIDEMAGDWHVYYATYLHYLEIGPTTTWRPRAFPCHT
jgi:acyl-CoA thioesterase FadM